MRLFFLGRKGAVSSPRRCTYPPRGGDQDAVKKKERKQLGLALHKVGVRYFTPLLFNSVLIRNELDAERQRIHEDYRFRQQSLESKERALRETFKVGTMQS